MFYGFFFLSLRLKTTTNKLSSSTRAGRGHEWRARVVREEAEPRVSAGSRRIRYISVREMCRKWVDSTRWNKRRQKPAVKAERSEMSHDNDTGNNRVFCVILTLHVTVCLHAVGVFFFFFFLHIFICTESWRTLRTLLQFFPVSVSLSPWQRQGAHSFLTQRIQGSFFCYPQRCYIQQWIVGKKMASIHLCCKQRASICHLYRPFQSVAQRSRTTDKMDFIYFLVNLWKDGWACMPLRARFRIPEPSDSREAPHTAALRPVQQRCWNQVSVKAAFGQGVQEKHQVWNNIMLRPTRRSVRLWPALVPQFWRNRWLNGPSSGLMGTFTSAWPASCPPGSGGGAHKLVGATVVGNAGTCAAVKQM